MGQWLEQAQNRKDEGRPAIPEICPFCELHDELAVALALCRGSSTWQKTDEGHVMAVASQVRAQVEKARNLCASLILLTTDGRSELETIRARLTAVMPLLGRGASRGEASVFRDVLADLEVAWERSYKLATNYYVGDPCARGVCPVTPLGQEPREEEVDPDILELADRDPDAALAEYRRRKTARG